MSDPRKRVNARPSVSGGADPELFPDSATQEMVAPRRLELLRPFERQILSLVRLPIPPQGPKHYRNNADQNQFSVTFQDAIGR